MAESSSPAEVDYLDLCGNRVRNLEDVVARGERLLNSRQCKDLSSKISRITSNVRELVLCCKTSIVSFRPALENLYRCVEKAEALVRSCAKGDWCAAAALQIQNESVFGDILLDVSSCYKAIHEVAKSSLQDWNGVPEDLHQSSVFESAMAEDVHKDQEDLEKRLNDSAQVVLLNLCRTTVLCIRNLVKSDKVSLNQRQCVDLSTKLCIAALNVFQLVSRGGASVAHFQLALESLYRFLENAKALVSSCAEDDWLSAAVFQIDNENAFRMILLDVSLCYNAMYELAKSTSTDWNNAPEDLRQPSTSVFKPARKSDVDDDKVDLQKRLDDLANGYTKFKPMDYLMPGKMSRTRSLAKYLLVKMCSTLSDPQEVALSKYSGVLWRKVSEPMFTWGNPRFLGAGSGASGVVSTTWLGIPCAKKEFHGQVNEGSFLKEAGILAHLKHPCIVNFICCGNGLERGDRFIAMELMDKSLLDLIEEQKDVHFPAHVAIDIIVQMARGVCYLHGRGVAHRDLKPQNVVVKRLRLPYVEDHFCMKLVDFGISKIKVETSQLNTMTAQGIGTTMYRAAEANPGEEGRVNWFKADAFSFGMTCAHVLSLKVPFEGLSPSELYKEVSKKGRRPKLPDMYPQELLMLIRDCWKSDPNLRPSFLEICMRLETFKYGGQGVEVDKSDSRLDLKYIKKVFKENSSKEHVLVEEEKIFASQVPILPCTCGSSLEFLHESPKNYKGICYCNICWEDCHEEVYHCETCEFDSHPNCVEMKEKVEVFFHNHPLHLLVRNYYNDKLDATCYFCKESLQHSDWVYRCEQCDLDVHALCTKYPEERMAKFWHHHALNLTQYFSEKSLSCKCCNGEVRTNSWRYTCIYKYCAYDIHPYCIILPHDPLCICDGSHRIHLISRQGGFYCKICNLLGFSSHAYNCEQCNLDIHLECWDNSKDDDDHWREAYEEIILHHGIKENHIMMHMITKVLEKFLGGDPSNGSLLRTSSPTSVAEGSARRVEPIIQRLASSQTPNLDAIDFDDVDLRNKIAVETAERKARRMTAKAGRVDSKAKYLEMLKNLERMVLDLRSSRSVLQGDGEVLDASLEKLKVRKHSVEDEMASLVQSEIRHGPRTCLFFVVKYKDGTVLELQTSLRADMEGVWVRFLCEEPGHQHDVDVSLCRVFDGALGEEVVQKLQPLLGRGLEVVARVVSALRGQLTPLDRVTLPVLGSNLTWDLRAIEVEKHGKPWKEKENADTLTRAEDSAAEWILSDLEKQGSIYKNYGLLRVRYKVTEEGECPGYTRGSVAWLCKEHGWRGLEAGILESYPVKFCNPELN